MISSMVASSFVDTATRLCTSTLVVFACPGLPRPVPLHFHHQRPAQKCADKHQQTQCSDVGQVEFEGDRPHQIPCHHQIQPHQQGPAQQIHVALVCARF